MLTAADPAWRLRADVSGATYVEPVVADGGDRGSARVSCGG
ncbi:hypothetical protein ACFWVP_24040 [Streptomyces sp. NPDC058637]